MSEKATSLAGIVQENLGPLLAAALISSLGGVALGLIEKRLFIFLPILMTIPALADMVGDFGSIIASKSVAMIEEGVMPKDWAHSKRVLKLALYMFGISIFYSGVIGTGALVVAARLGYLYTGLFIAKFALMLLLLNLALIAILVVFSIRVGFAVAYRGHDPDNYLIPLVTSVADLGVLLLFALLTSVLF